MKKGLFDIVNRGLVPKFADLTPAFHIEGNPLNVSNKVIKTNYVKNNMRDDIINLHDININSMKYAMEDIIGNKPKLKYNRKYFSSNNLMNY